MGKVVHYDFVIGPYVWDDLVFAGDDFGMDGGEEVSNAGDPAFGEMWDWCLREFKDGAGKARLKLV